MSLTGVVNLKVFVGIRTGVSEDRTCDINGTAPFSLTDGVDLSKGCRMDASGGPNLVSTRITDPRVEPTKVSSNGGNILPLLTLKVH